MSTNSRKALGDAGLHVIHSTGKALKDLDRQVIRARIEGKPRPAPGTSELLSRPMTQEVIGWGKKDVVMHDIVMGLAPVHLRGGRIDKEVKGETLRKKLEKEGL